MESTACPEDKRDDRSEASAAVVSVYHASSGRNSASSATLNPMTPCDPIAAAAIHGRRARLRTMTEAELLAALRQRCRPPDLPGRLPPLRPRRHPICLFVNYLGQTPVERLAPSRHPPPPHKQDLLYPTLSTLLPVAASRAALVSEPPSPLSMADMDYGGDCLDVMEDFHLVFDDDDDDSDDASAFDPFDAIVQVRKRPRLADSPLSFSDASVDYPF